MMIKKLVTITAIIMLLGSPASYAAFSGNKLKEDCDSKAGSFTKGACIGYIIGTYDSIKWVEESDLPSCPPDAMTGKQLISIVEKYLEEAPQLLHYPAYPLIAGALKKAFPCPD
jgi:hypothetical protein